MLSNIYKETEKNILKEDTLLVKLVAHGKPFEEYDKLFKDTNIRFTIIDYQGKVYFDSKQPNQEVMDNHSGRQEVLSAIYGNSGFAIRKSKTLGSYYAYYATKYKLSPEDKYIIRISEDYTEKMEQIKTVAWILSLFFIFLNFVSYFFYKNYLKRDLENKIKIMKGFLESGELERKIFYGREEKWLYEFWEILEEWQKNNLDNIAKLDFEKKILDLIISSVDAFIGLIDNNGNFVLKNNSLNHLLIIDSQKYTESFKYIEIITLIKNSITLKKDIRKEVYVNGIKEYFLISVKYIKKNDQFLVAIKDITSTRRTVEIQKNFISNVSHELKTPLTNIKGYLIALEDAPKEIRLRFLNIINNNVEKLENIVLDFLNISKIESSKILQVVPVEPKLIEDQIRESLFGIIKRKKAELNFNWNLLEINQGMINTDKEKLIMILKNLIENGIIYNTSDVPSIKVDITEEKSKYLFSVKDNGIGIPQDKLKKVFERFYRVDKARTSNMGGTGLGLAIVKELVEQFGGEIVIESSEHEGSNFRFYFLK
ncbi:MAG: ATP-binding protein [Fusobacterium sp.]|uniref:sensor histidine kinase n=1 Tax=Fusobacterium sp. TaxID=68766 RepID=UPI002A75B763|nr:ATP-binding protein [Fusobacterium sp.]MDY2980432.1 ATP-binding protein [Fusobacterium sp.]